MVGSMIDLTQTRLFQERFRFLAEAMPQKVWTTDSKGTIDYFNKHWLDYTGLDYSELSKNGWNYITHADDLTHSNLLWSDAIAKGDNYETETRYLKSDGTYRWHLTRAIVQKDENGKPIMWVGTATDIDDQKKIEQQLKSAQLVSERLMQKKDEFIGIASHELKTPLTSVKASLQIVKRLLEAEKFEKMFSFVEKAELHISKLTGLVNDLLDVSKISAGKMHFNISDFPVSDVIKLSVDFIATYSSANKITIEGETEVIIEADKTRLEQVISNLLSNAVKYSDPGSDIIINIRKEKYMLFISIQDFGVGIPEDKIPYIFDRYFRAEEVSFKFSGLGLGLYISQEIIKRHGGNICVKSKEGEGSKFQFHIPLQNTQSLINNDIA